MFEIFLIKFVIYVGIDYKCLIVWGGDFIWEVFLGIIVLLDIVS